MQMRHLLSKLDKNYHQDFKLFVNRSTVASVIKYRRSAYAICMLNILQGASKNAEVLQMIYLKVWISIIVHILRCVEQFYFSKYEI
jgi:hypothetical protein